MQEQLVIERAFGAVRFFATLAPEFLNDPYRCVPVLSDFIERNRAYGFIGVVPVSGIVTCASAPGTYNFNGAPGFAETTYTD